MQVNNPRKACDLCGFNKWCYYSAFTHSLSLAVFTHNHSLSPCLPPITERHQGDMREMDRNREKERREEAPPPHTHTLNEGKSFNWGKREIREAAFPGQRNLDRIPWDSIGRAAKSIERIREKRGTKSHRWIKQHGRNRKKKQHSRTGREG